MAQKGEGQEGGCSVHIAVEGERDDDGSEPEGRKEG